MRFNHRRPSLRPSRPASHSCRHALAFEGTPHPAEALRWQRELRQAAETWRQLSDCRHEPPLRYEARLAEQFRERVAEHLRAVEDEPLWHEGKQGAPS